MIVVPSATCWPLRRARCGSRCPWARRTPRSASLTLRPLLSSAARALSLGCPRTYGHLDLGLAEWRRRSRRRCRGRRRGRGRGSCSITWSAVDRVRRSLAIVADASRPASPIAARASFSVSPISVGTCSSVGCDSNSCGRRYAAPAISHDDQEADRGTSARSRPRPAAGRRSVVGSTVAARRRSSRRSAPASAGRRRRAPAAAAGRLDRPVGERALQVRTHVAGALVTVELVLRQRLHRDRVERARDVGVVVRGHVRRARGRAGRPRRRACRRLTGAAR